MELIRPCQSRFSASPVLRRGLGRVGGRLNAHRVAWGKSGSSSSKIAANGSQSVPLMSLGTPNDQEHPWDPLNSRGIAKSATDLPLVFGLKNQKYFQRRTQRGASCRSMTLFCSKNQSTWRIYVYNRMYYKKIKKKNLKRIENLLFPWPTRVGGRYGDRTWNQETFIFTDGRWVSG